MSANWFDQMKESVEKFFDTASDDDIRAALKNAGYEVYFQENVDDIELLQYHCAKIEEVYSKSIGLEWMAPADVKLTCSYIYNQPYYVVNKNMCDMVPADNDVRYSLAA